MQFVRLPNKTSNFVMPPNAQKVLQTPKGDKQPLAYRLTPSEIEALRADKKEKLSRVLKANPNNPPKKSA